LWTEFAKRKIFRQGSSDSYLQKMLETSDENIAEQAKLILEIGLICPCKKRRLKILTRERRDLIAKLEETGLIFAHHG